MDLWCVWFMSYFAYQAYMKLVAAYGLGYGSLSYAVDRLVVKHSCFYGFITLLLVLNPR